VACERLNNFDQHKFEVVDHSLGTTFWLMNAWSHQLSPVGHHVASSTSAADQLVEARHSPRALTLGACGSELATAMTSIYPQLPKHHRQLWASPEGQIAATGNSEGTRMTYRLQICGRIGSTKQIPKVTLLRMLELGNRGGVHMLPNRVYQHVMYMHLSCIRS
jgi:hypothetical protein